MLVKPLEDKVLYILSTKKPQITSSSNDSFINICLESCECKKENNCVDKGTKAGRCVFSFSFEMEEESPVVVEIFAGVRKKSCTNFHPRWLPEDYFCFRADQRAPIGSAWTSRPSHLSIYCTFFKKIFLLPSWKSIF